MKNDIITQIDLLRHGELKTKGLFCAPREELLSEQGWQGLSKATIGKSWDVIISSDFERCSRFAKVLATQQGIDLKLSEQFQEMNFGRWVGLLTKDIWQTDHQQLSKLWSDTDNFTAPDGEALIDFNKRVETGLLSILQQYQGKSILIITHSGVIRSILRTALNISNSSALKFTIEYAQLTHLHYYADGEFSLQAFGCSR